MSETQTIQTREIVQNFYQALANRELQKLTGFFAEQTDWDIPGDQELAPWLGKRENKRQIKAFFELLWQNTEPVTAQIEHILAEGDFAVATGYFSSKMLRSSQIYSSIFSAHFTIKNGQIVRYRFLEDSNGLVEALCLP
jgi:ketosteroid isomerase-like protein